MIKKFLLTTILLTTHFIFAQRSNSSPYSFFGLGDEFNPQTVEQAGLGGAGVAFSSNRYLNFINPASIADLRVTTFTFGLLNNDLTIKDNSGSQNSTSTNLNYLALGFPVGKRAGFAFGIRPYSATGYSLVNTIRDSNNNVTGGTTFSGSGGVNSLFFNYGIYVLKNFSLGAEVNFSFGQNEYSILTERVGVTLGTKYREETTIRGTSFKLGAIYKKEIKKGINLNVGASLELDNSLNTEGTETIHAVLVSAFGQQFARDTLSFKEVKGSLKIPLKSVFGVSIGNNNKWLATAEYESQNQIDTQNFLNNSTNTFKFASSNRISVGGFYIPKANSISSYWERVTYRTGVRFQRTGLLVDGSGTGTNFTPIDDFGITIGLGLPLGNRLSNINMSLEYGQRGTTNNNLIQENYVNFRLSLSLNDINWFRKRQID